MNYPNHVTRYNHRPAGFLDAPRTYRVRMRDSTDYATMALVGMSIAVLIVVTVMMLQAV